MTERARSDRVEQIVNAILTGGDASGALQDHELAPLARLALGLKHCPSSEFKARLRARLQEDTSMAVAMTALQLREGFATVTPYLSVQQPGLVDFLHRVFDAVETRSTRDSAGFVQREVRLGESTIVIGEGAPGGEASGPGEFHVYVEDVDAAFQRAMAAGATSLGEPADRPYGERAGFVRDPFGNHWYIATHHGESYVPEGLATLTPFVHARGASQYIEFLKRAFGAVEERRHEIGGGVIRYGRVRIGNAAVELGEAESSTEPLMSAFYLYVSNPDAVYEHAVAAGATPLSPPATLEEGDRVASVEDPAGKQWWLISRPARR